MDIHIETQALAYPDEDIDEQLTLYELHLIHMCNEECEFCNGE